VNQTTGGANTSQGIDLEHTGKLHLITTLRERSTIVQWYKAGCVCDKHKALELSIHRSVFIVQSNRHATRNKELMNSTKLNSGFAT
jgi:hypothetical protein